MPVTVVQPRFVNGGPKRGGEATERGEGVIFQNFCLKTAFSGTLDRPTFIRGSLCSGIDLLIPYSCSFFILFLMNLFQGNIFLFPFFLLLFYSPINGVGGGGGMAPLCILTIPVTVQPRFVNGGKARERSDRARGMCFSPSHCREIFVKICV